MIEIRNLKIEARGKILLDDISLDLKEGRIYALLGENGCGKTTLIRSLSSFFPSYSGSIRFSGKELWKIRKKERGKLHSVLPQTLPSLDIPVNCLLDRTGLSILDGLGLSRILGERISVLSGGEKEMVFLSLMLSRDTLLYSFDEAEANLDARYRMIIEEKMIELKGRGKTVLSSFHDIGRAYSVADEIIVLSEGKLAFFGDKEKFLSSGVPEKCLGLSPRRAVDEEMVERILFL